jgi:hypothetical protein
VIPRAESSSVRGGFLKTVVPIVPDAQVGHFRLTLLGGSKGYLVNTRSLCVGKRPKVSIVYGAHNGRRHKQRIGLRAPCGKKKRSSTSHTRVTARG